MDYAEPVPQPSPSDASLEDASMHTVTASSVNALPHIHNHNISDSADSARRPQTSYSDTGFASNYQSQDNTPDPQHSEDQMPQYPSRPSSRLNRQNSDYSDQNAQRQQAQKNASVVIKVGMVGDAQIGKTSLMVKYVEGSWDEDYIQTLGAQRSLQYSALAHVLTFPFRCEFHGKDD